MASLGTRRYLALDASSVAAAVLGGSLGSRRARSFLRVPLEPGALVPSPSGPSLARREDVKAAVRRAVEALGRGRVTLVLPDGLARLAILDLPRGAEPRDFVRFRLAASLPWPASEAIVDFLPVAPGRVVGAAVRRSIVAEYEEAVDAAGAEVERVHLAPLLALEGLKRAGARNAVHAVLGDVALCLATFDEGALVALRSRRRDRSSGEASRLRDELERTALSAGNGAGPLRTVLSGADAARLRRELGGEMAGPGLDGPGEWDDAKEAAWLGGLLS